MSRSAHKTRGVRTVTPDPGLYAGPEFSLRMFTVLVRSNKPPQVVVIDRADPGTDLTYHLPMVRQISPHNLTDGGDRGEGSAPVNILYSH